MIPYLSDKVRAALFGADEAWLKIALRRVGRFDADKIPFTFTECTPLIIDEWVDDFLISKEQKPMTPSLTHEEREALERGEKG